MTIQHRRIRLCLMAPRARRPWFTGLRRRITHVMLGVALMGGPACRGLADEQLPPDVQSPDRLKTPSGAISRYHGALTLVPNIVDRFLVETGILTDELNDIPTPPTVSGLWEGIDGRYDLTGFATTYGLLHKVRGEAREARGYLQ